MRTNSQHLDTHQVKDTEIARLRRYVGYSLASLRKEMVAMEKQLMTEMRLMQAQLTLRLLIGMAVLPPVSERLWPVLESFLR
ncbi:MAG TPA: hypothetical protein DCE41_15795 [Cytophagales bacterium]|nr:hypothetical protein [Cytophagales bacterium]HAA23377.1 hypothetical protein [Cytophagales bacterium]HAP63689.1 hypothetical protein [Cytophagales bacterium]